MVDRRSTPRPTCTEMPGGASCVTPGNTTAITAGVAWCSSGSETRLPCSVGTRCHVAPTALDPHMNRLKQFFGEPQEPDRSDNFFEIECRYETFAVTPATALEIERRLDQLPPSRWIAFRDLSGARHRILGAHISRISESTLAQRAAAREFRRARRLEDKSDRPWDEDY
jgi:hypothetical protein